MDKVNTKHVEQDRVDIFIPKGNDNDDPNLFVGFNGKNYLLPKGKTSSVPRDVANEILRARNAEEVRDENMDKLKESASK